MFEVLFKTFSQETVKPLSMSKQETINKYIDAFLKGRSPEATAKFRNKDIDKQYASIMQWRRKIRKQQNTPQSAKEIIEYIRKSRMCITNAPMLREDDVNAILSELAKTESELIRYMENQRIQKIRELESQQEAIRIELEQLRGKE